MNQVSIYLSDLGKVGLVRVLHPVDDRVHVAKVHLALGVEVAGVRRRRRGVFFLFFTCEVGGDKSI